MSTMNSASLIFFIVVVFLTAVSLSDASSNEGEGFTDTAAQRQLAASGPSDWYARLVGTLLSGAAKASSTAHLPPTAPPPSSTNAGLSVQASHTTPSPPSGFLSSTMNPGNWFSARTHTPTPSYSTASKSSTTRGISSWVSSISSFLSGFKTQKKDTSTNDEEGIDAPEFAPIYGDREQYSPTKPYFNVLLPEHQTATPCIAVSVTPDRKNMYVGNGERPWEAQAAALKRCYHDGQQVCELSGGPVVSMGACIAVAKSDSGILFSASLPMQDDEGLSTKQAALSKCAMTSQRVCLLEYFDCPF